MYVCLLKCANVDKRFLKKGKNIEVVLYRAWWQLSVHSLLYIGASCRT